MKPCLSRRESVALLACETLPDRGTDELRRHLTTCDGCRDYFQQCSAVRDDLMAAARDLPDAEVSPRLRDQIAMAIRADADRRQDDPLFSGWARLAGATVFLMLLVGGVLLLRKPAPPVPIAAKPAPPLTGKAHFQAGNINLLTYRLALNRSPEALDELLAQEAARPTSSTPAGFRVSLARAELGL